jgi:hypothetical protein
MMSIFLKKRRDESLELCPKKNEIGKLLLSYVQKSNQSSFKSIQEDLLRSMSVLMMSDNFVSPRVGFQSRGSVRKCSILGIQQESTY